MGISPDSYKASGGILPGEIVENRMLENEFPGILGPYKVQHRLAAVLELTTEEANKTLQSNW